MLKAILDATIESVQRRDAQGDCPTEPPFSVEHLEGALLSLVLQTGYTPCSTPLGDQPERRRECARETPYQKLDTVALMELRCDFGRRNDAIRREIRDRVVSATIMERLDLDPRDIRQYYDELYDKATGNRRGG